MSYHLTGLLSSFFVSLSLTGIALQLRLVWQRKRAYQAGGLCHERPTSVLSVNRFFTSFLAFFTMFLYGLTLEKVNHYIVWPRVAALSLLLLILFEIQRDRRDRLSRTGFGLAAGLVALALLLAASPYRVTWNTSGAAHVMVLLAMGLFAQGALYQIAAVRRAGRTGALSLRMHQLFLLKDLFSVIFGLAMGFPSGWPVIAFHSTGLVVQTTTMWHFRWVRVSPAARARRARQTGGAAAAVSPQATSAQPG